MQHTHIYSERAAENIAVLDYTQDIGARKINLKRALGSTQAVINIRHAAATTWVNSLFYLSLAAKRNSFAE